MALTPIASVGPSTYEAFHSLIQPYPQGAGLSLPEAVRVIQSERDNLELIAEIIDKEGIRDDVDFWKGDLCEGESARIVIHRLLTQGQSTLHARQLGACDKCTISGKLRGDHAA